MAGRRGSLRCSGAHRLRMLPSHPPPLAPPNLIHQVFNENNSPFYDENMAAANPKALAALSEDDLIEANTKYSINGFLWCNQPNVTMRIGERCATAAAGLGGGCQGDQGCG